MGVILAEAELKGLLLAGLDGDAGAYRRVLEAIQRRLQAYFTRRLRGDPAEVEDLVQDTLIAVHNKRATFDRSQLVTAWVYAIARYKLIDHYRRKGRRSFVGLDDADDLYVEDESAAVDARRDIGRGLADLPEKTRDLVRSVKLEDASIAEVAQRTGMSEGAVKVAVHRGFKKLTETLRRQDRTGDGA